METLSMVSSVTTIVKIANDITGAVKAVNRNKKSCKKLAERVEGIGELLKELGNGSSSSSPSTAAATRSLVSRLERALRRGLLLVRSCQVSSRIYSLIASSWQADQFDEVNAVIDRCLLDLSLASLTLISGIDRKLNAAGDTAEASICQPPPSPRCSQVHDDVTEDDDKDKMAGVAAARDDVGDDEKNGALICYDEQDVKDKKGATAAGEVTTIGVHAPAAASPPPPSYGYYYLHCHCHCTHGLGGGCYYQQRGDHYCHCAAAGGHYSSSYPWYSDSIDVRHMFSDENHNSCSTM